MSDGNGRPRLTYCGNCHGAESLEEWLGAVVAHTLPVANARREQGRDFGLGTWWDHGTLWELTRSADAERSLDRVRELLVAHDLEVWTVNGFPTGPFHGTPVKGRVYTPDWWHEERLDYTVQLFQLVGQLCDAGNRVPISTLPLGYENRRSADPAVAAGHLQRAVDAAVDLFERTGVLVQLALEPEPHCLAETVAQQLSWLEQHAPGGVPGERWRRHLGVCVDLCHAAVVGEDPVSGVHAVRDAGFTVPKVQVSACLELRDPAAGLDRLLAFHEPVYLHQTRNPSGGPKAVDLPDVANRRGEFAASDILRCHFHVPVFWDGDEVLGSTRSQVEASVPKLAALPHPPLLEVETYTWDVLREAEQDQRAGADPQRDLANDLLRELAFVDGLLG